MDHITSLGFPVTNKTQRKESKFNNPLWGNSGAKTGSKPRHFIYKATDHCLWWKSLISNNIWFSQRRFQETNTVKKTCLPTENSTAQLKSHQINTKLFDSVLSRVVCMSLTWFACMGNHLPAFLQHCWWTSLWEHGNLYFYILLEDRQTTPLDSPSL